MNKRDARKYAARMIHAIVEQIACAPSRQKTIPVDPLVYDCLFADCEGRYMTKDDAGKVVGALIDLGEVLYQRGSYPLAHGIPRASGKPGRKWSGYRDQRRRQGYNSP